MTEAVQEIVDAGAAEKVDAGATDTAAVDAGAGEDKAGATQEVDAGKTDTAKADTTDAADKDAVKPTWPDDWREQMAGTDEAFLKALKRYSSPSTFAKGWQERENLIRSGKLKQAKPDGTDEKALSEWRKENGVPDDPTGYKVPDAVQKVLVDTDKPLVAEWFDSAHKAGMPQEMAEKGLEWYATVIDKLQAQQNATDTEASEKCEDFLRKEWAHADYKANTTLGARWLAAETPLGEDWANLRSSDGRRLGDNPDFMMWAADKARESYGDVSFATGDSERKFVARKEEIEAVMKSDIDRYYHEGLDKEYATILQKETKRAR